MPHKAAGCLIDPPVSVPVASVAKPAATAAAEPPDEPPGTRAVSQGFLAAPKKLVSLEEPIANSSILHLPRLIIPAVSSLLTTVALYGGINSASIFDAQVVRTSRVQKISLCSIGIPNKGETSPLAKALSACAAAAKARSSHEVMTALSAGFKRAIRDRLSSVSSLDETEPVRSCCDNAARVLTAFAISRGLVALRSNADPGLVHFALVPRDQPRFRLSQF